MDAEPEPRRMPVGRSWAFVQPLLITVGGVGASIVIYLAAVDAFEPPCTDAYCGFGIGRLISAAILLCLPLAGMIITGFIASQQSRDPGLAGPAILVGMPVIWLGLMVATDQDATLSSVVSVLSLILVGIGFGLERRRHPSPADPSGPTSSE